ncbi:ABC transporter ATP-binding protein [Oricola cellulosilytica]|uniref:ABC transporter ATP-binding protein n=1 Tax=Oricola cellulosilytica TaxID=1429082 RepID=A0A4R0P4U7_9HYPH|nr:ABC transporter ATP-binding protein [Oricola cellulosilytica]
MALELKQVGKRVAGETHVYPTDLVLERGSFNTLLGTTLAGKTTLMQLMAGLEKPTTGEIWFDDVNVTGRPVQKRNVSMVYQQFINYPNMTVFDNIASPLRVARHSEDEIKKRVGAMAELMKISAMLDRRPSELSGGQQQRTAMARAMVKDSDLILLDEPLANLDFKLREELRDELPRIFGQRNCVVVYATTEPSEALLFGGKTAALYEGRVTDFGATGKIYRHPRDLTSAMVFSEPPINTANVRKTEGRILMNENVTWTAPAGLPDGAYTIGIRPHHISPITRDPEAVAIEGTVKVAELSGSESMIHFDAYGDSWVSLSHGVHPFDAGERAVLYADVSRCFYFDTNGKLVAAGGGHTEH